MKKDRINTLLRIYVKDTLSPTQYDIQFVSRIYKSFNELLGTNNCIQIGSYPRYTAVRPLHDLDIPYIFGDWADINEVPERLMTDLAQKFRKEYKNPTRYKIDIAVQTHSISFRYLDFKDEEVFAVDLVPALKKGQNEFGKSMFYVPEIIKQRRGDYRKQFYNEAIRTKKEIIWIKTDPLGYIEVASIINNVNDDFRKAVKFVKGWKNCCKEINDEFKLKSFHLEQLVTRDYQQNKNLDIFDAVFKFFTELKQNILTPNIKDRADGSKYIDNYLNDLSASQRNLINQAVDAIIIAFEEADEYNTVKKIIKSGFYKRNGVSENFLFDQKIPVLTDDSKTFIADGFIEKFDGFRKFQASIKKSSGIVDTKNSIEFRITENNTNADIIKWKVKNDNSSAQPRGEITDRRTLQNPENTAYIGKHYVEAYAIKNNVCLAKDKVYVIVKK